MANDSPSAKTPPYVPFRTFMNTIDALAAHMPNRIDRSAFPGQSGAGQNQLLLAFRFFGLIGDDGKPTAALLSLAVTDGPPRKAALKKIVEEKYSELLAINLLKTTPAEFAEKMTEAYEISGDTRLKATRFFLNAAEYLGVQVSPLLLRDKARPATGGATARRRRTARSRTDDTPERDSDTASDDPTTPAAESRSVELRSGGTLTLSATTKFMALSSTDRNFVFGLIDKLEEYERVNNAQAANES